MHIEAADVWWFKPNSYQHVFISMSKKYKTCLNSVHEFLPYYNNRRNREKCKKSWHLNQFSVCDTQLVPHTHRQIDKTNEQNSYIVFRKTHWKPEDKILQESNTFFL